jgi:ribonuclease P protein component
MMRPLVKSADFERTLAAPTRARSLHFAVHHLHGAPGVSAPPRTHKLSTELSTGRQLADDSPVDDPAAAVVVDAVWWGAVVPKRHARRSVTRSLLKRQIRAAMGRLPGLPPGMWVVRLRAPFPREQFPSAASEPLRRAARDELDTLLAEAARRAAGGG